MNLWRDLAQTPARVAAATTSNNPWQPTDPAAALRNLLAVVESLDERDRDPRWRYWLLHGLRTYLAGDGSLDAALDLPSPAARRRAEQEHLRLVALRLVLLSGWPPEVPLTRRIERLSALLRGDPPRDGEKDIRAALAGLPLRMPYSERRLWQLAPAALSLNNRRTTP